MKGGLFAFNVNSLLLLVSTMLLFSGLLNAVFQGTLLAGWKQLLVVLAFIFARRLVCRDKFLLKFCDFTIGMSIFLLINSLLLSVSLKVAFFNIFFYISWVPFYIWAAIGGVKLLQERDQFIFVYLIISCVGLIIDLKTDYFSFLNVRNEVVTMEYLALHGIANRAAFIFTASNLVMTVIGGLIVLFLAHKQTTLRMLFCFMVMILVILTTASANAFLLACFVTLGVLGRNPKVSARTTMITLIVGGLGLFLIGLNITNIGNMFDGQIERLVGNTNLNTVSNVGRFISWEAAFRDISSFSILEHISGTGLGSTNSNHNKNVLYGHGESSFLQAYIEGGGMGLLFRLLPFMLLLRTVSKYQRRSVGPFIGYCIGIFLVYSIAPLFGNILSQMILGMIVGHVYFARKSDDNCLLGNRVSD
jgi:hypothetical protein